MYCSYMRTWVCCICVGLTLSLCVFVCMWETGYEWECVHAKERIWVRVCVCECDRDRERVGERVCVSERERELASVCVCDRGSWREWECVCLWVCWCCSAWVGVHGWVNSVWVEHRRRFLGKKIPSVITDKRVALMSEDGSNILGGLKNKSASFFSFQKILRC